MDKKYSKDDIYSEICNILVSEFDIDKSKLNQNANLFQDLDLDSIDVVDLAVRLQQFTQKRLSPEEFKQIKTVQDIVNTLYSLI